MDLADIEESTPTIKESASRVSARLAALFADAKAAERDEGGDVLSAQSVMTEDEMIVDVRRVLETAGSAEQVRSGLEPLLKMP